MPRSSGKTRDLDFEGAEAMLPRALTAARAIAALKQRARRAGVPVVYVNDNFGKWRSDFHEVLEHCLQAPGRDIAALLAPDKDDYFVLKPKHSGFQHTTLKVLLAHLGCETLVLTGVAAISACCSRRTTPTCATSTWVTKADIRPSAEWISRRFSRSCTAGTCPTARRARGRPSRAARARCPSRNRWRS